jgi:hypothetical protein
MNKNSQLTEVLQGLTFYCKECNKIIQAQPSNFKIVCPEKGCTQIAYGTEKSIKNFYKIKDAKFDAERLEREKMAVKADKF